MMRTAALAALATAVEAAVTAVKVGDAHPMEKVIAMLKDLSAQATEEGKTEAVAYDKFAHWCATSTKTLSEAISEEKSKIEGLKAQISGEEKLIAELTKQIAQLEKEIEEANQAAKAAEDIRKETADLYAQASSDHKATIAAIEEAIAGLVESGKGGAAFLAKAKQSPKLKQALFLVQAALPEDVPVAQRSALAALVQASPERPEQLAEGDRAAHVLDYDFKSGDIIELLKKLQHRFEEELLAADKAETNSLNSYDLEKQARDAAIAAAEKSKGEKETTKGDTEESMAVHKEELADTEADLAADSSTLSDTEKDCATKKQEWEERSSVRANEIEAMNVAVSILAKVTGVRTEAPSNPIPPPAPTEAAASFLQMPKDARMKALNLLRSKAKEMHSKSLARYAQELSTHMDDPFGEVNNMIEKMIYRLMQEQTDEDNHKMWCDQEISQTNTSREDKEAKIEDLSMKIDDATAHSQKLTMDIEAADEMVSKITSFMAEATEIREVGKKENDLALKDAKDAQTAVSNAIAVLTDFYKSSGKVAKESWEAFIQTKGKGKAKGKEPVDLPENPATWDTSYSGVADPKEQPAGIITVLEAVGADFAKMEADTKAQEAEDQATYEEVMKESTIEKAERAKESEVKNAERGRVVNKLEEMKKRRKTTEGELEAVNQYYKDLGPACYEGDSTYDDRKAARTQEIDALKSAKETLNTAFDEKAEPEEGNFLVKKNKKVAPVRKH